MGIKDVTQNLEENVIENYEFNSSHGKQNGLVIYTYINFYELNIKNGKL